MEFDIKELGKAFWGGALDVQAAQDNDFTIRFNDIDVCCGNRVKYDMLVVLVPAEDDGGVEIYIKPKKLYFII